MSSFQRRRKSMLERFSFQRLGGIIFAAIVPYLVGIKHGLLPSYHALLNDTLMGTSIATVIAIWLSRSIEAHRGEESTSSLSPSFGLAYGGLITFFVLSRFQYHRANLVVGL